MPVLEAFRALDFRVVVEQFLTDTAQEADVVLPAKTMFEQSDVIGAYWHPYLQLKQKVLEPPGEVKPESEVYWLLAERLGIAPEARVAAGMPEPGDAGVEAFLRRHLDALGAEVTLERLAEGPVIAPGHQEIAFSDGVFPTPSGRIELRSEEATRRWGVDELPSYSESVESVRRGGGTEEGYPLYFMTPNTKNRIHSQFNNLRSIRAFSPAPYLQIHPDDARPRGIAEGTRVRVFNERGSVEVAAPPGPRHPGGVRLHDQRLVDRGGWNGELLLRGPGDRHGPRRGVPRQPGAGGGGGVRRTRDLGCGGAHRPRGGP